jgi:hypothetical protein
MIIDTEKITNDGGFINEEQIENKVKAILFLNAITGYECKIRDLHHPLYNNENDLHQDLKKWEEWYKENKCGFTSNKADSLLLLYNTGKLKR